MSYRVLSAMTVLAFVLTPVRAMAQSGINPSTAAFLNDNAESDAGDDTSPRTAQDGDGLWITVWTSTDGAFGDDADVLMSRSSNGGQTWSAPAAVNTDASTDARTDLSPRIAADGQGRWIVVWSAFTSDGDTTTTEEADIFFARSLDGGMTWSAPSPLNSDADGDTDDDLQPTVSADPFSSWVCAWHTAGDGRDSDIRYCQSNDHGQTWSTAATLNQNAATDAGNDTDVAISNDGAGHWLAVWTSSDSLSGTIGSDEDILYSRSGDSGATWSPPRPLNTDAATDAKGDRTPTIAADGQGRWLVVWAALEIWSHSIVQLDVTQSSDVDLLCARSSDDGDTWSAPNPVNSDACNNGLGTRSDIQPSLNTDGTGNWIVIWTNAFGGSGFGSSVNPILHVARSTDFGLTWTAVEMLNPDADTESQSTTIDGALWGFFRDEDQPCLSNDGAGNWLAVWRRQTTGLPRETPDTDADLRFTRFSLGLCGQDGNACSVPGVQPSPACGQDLCGGVGCSWLTMAFVGLSQRRRRRRSPLQK